MIITKEITMLNFEPWSGAVYTYDTLYNANALDTFESIIEELYPEGVDETQLNDILWFDSEWCFEVCGISEEEEEE